MKLIDDGVWWVKATVWNLIDRFVAWVLEQNDRAVERDDYR